MSTTQDSTPPPNSTSSLDVSQPADLLTYLANTPFASTRVEPLSGGYGNFIFRLHLVKPFAASTGENLQTVILKHAKPWAASDKSFDLAIERQATEATALKHVRSFLPVDALATVPELYLHDPEAHIIIMEDAGPSARNLKDLLRTVPLNEETSRELGAAMGRFLAAVHVHGTADTALIEATQNIEDARRITAWITYGRLVDSLKEAGNGTTLVDPPLVGSEGVSETQLAEVKELVDSTIKKIYDARTDFTMGDFWTGNIVVRLTPNKAIERIFVVDWEISKPGLQFADFAQFAAEMNTLRRFHPEAETSVVTALSAYKEAYIQGKEVDEQFLRSAASHLGAHMITISPRVENWNGTKEQIREVVKEGVEYLLGGMNGDVQWLNSSVVGS
ncbi:uncharacterized protein FOMMEDRAFT_23526 [Fomitiporia mediterranea MF3/22]|uniref:uncharacterized protein n=1 Tax=Fomitiporia mediterranea (strain MF3/22) TaxID=694068 RepID=UPI000440784D|nr:uncharacterized protein FOMMEDRAFT_23526 [Fomitiporia mediterranea MF3/22]EJC98715.1 hypothetical protein FOMMEDRAFT_23526 [Fomitiporia mediterranea MF3/22]